MRVLKYYVENKALLDDRDIYSIDGVFASVFIDIDKHAFKKDK